MFNRLLPKNLGFFDLFERHAQHACEAAQAMQEALKALPNKAQIQCVQECEHQCDDVAHMTIELMRKTFITPFDREEIRHLISKMDDVADYVDAAATRLDLFEVKEAPKELKEICDVLVRAQKEVLKTMKLLRNMKNTQELQDVLKNINSLENEGDRLHRAGLVALFQGDVDPLTVIKLKDIYSMLEEAVDSCEDVAHVVEGIIIEHVG
ncbi:MAG: DUF47 domain-containing protein [Myxococcales bacterium]|nr:MAG: DUF47 domain-containing protein [Myxococcales bacterium]